MTIAIRAAIDNQEGTLANIIGWSTGPSAFVGSFEREECVEGERKSRRTRVSASGIQIRNILMAKGFPHRAASLASAR